ncbi:hypothetical protein CEXT_295571 [Caerostris extrusa]|uniref:Uncharacterized protein n=1 Tax=Caerostris extrusa TaxID=172846 RepID=A0AAV4U7M6_CAEEX|nr:hypothetical protein CEXT_295571 [Caerostris extrusa]
MRYDVTGQSTPDTCLPARDPQYTGKRKKKKKRLKQDVVRYRNEKFRDRIEFLVIQVFHVLCRNPTAFREFLIKLHRVSIFVCNPNLQ